MDPSEVEENLFDASNAKLHGEMCRKLYVVVRKLVKIFPDLEALRPGSKSGLKALCSLHMAIERAKSLLQHCSNSSKLYLAITGDSVLSKFSKARCALEESVRLVAEVVPQASGCQLLEIASKLEGIVFSLDPSEKQVGAELIALLQQERKLSSSSNDYSELSSFYHSLSKLHIVSHRAALIERRALKRLIERARVECDRRKESIIAYLLHNMYKCSKQFKSEISDDSDSLGSVLCSPTVLGSEEYFSSPSYNGRTLQRELSKLNSFNFKTNNYVAGSLPAPPEEFICPISLQLMFDPVIISSGQTYERACIQKWFGDGHTTCPKMQHHLSNLNLTPNHCVRDLIVRWCESNEMPVPDGPPKSLDLNYWRLAQSDSEAADLLSKESIQSCKFKEAAVVPMGQNEITEIIEENEVAVVTSEQNEITEILEENEAALVTSERNEITEVLEDNGTGSSDSSCCIADSREMFLFERCEGFMKVLNEDGKLNKKMKIVEEIRLLLDDDAEARDFMGANGFVEALVHFIGLAVDQGNEKAQKIGAMALFNLAVDNNRNKSMILSQGVIEQLEKMILNPNINESAAALFLNLSYLDEAQTIIGSSCTLPILIRLLQVDSTPLCKLHVLHTLYNLSTLRLNIPRLISLGIIDCIQALLRSTAVPPAKCEWGERLIGLLVNLALSKTGKNEIIEKAGLINSLATKLEGEPGEQEQAASCLLTLCYNDKKCSRVVLKESMIPSLVLLSINGTERGKEKARRLLTLFEDQQRRNPLHVKMPSSPPQPVQKNTLVPDQMKPSCQLSSTKKRMRTWSLIWRYSRSHFPLQ